jgi:hypothetical protein
MVCHVLLVETGNGLVLIDTGFRPKDCGDAFFHHGAVDGTVPMPRELAAFECPFPGLLRRGTADSSRCGHPHQLHGVSTASFPLVKAPLAVLCRVLLRLLARESTKKS